MLIETAEGTHQVQEPGLCSCRPKTEACCQSRAPLLSDLIKLLLVKLLLTSQFSVVKISQLPIIN